MLICMYLCLECHSIHSPPHKTGIRSCETIAEKCNSILRKTKINISCNTSLSSLALSPRVRLF